MLQYTSFDYQTFGLTKLRIIETQSEKGLSPLYLIVKFPPSKELRVSPNLANCALHFLLVFMHQSLLLQWLFAATGSLLSSVKTEKKNTKYSACTNSLACIVETSNIKPALPNQRSARAEISWPGLTRPDVVSAR